MSLSGNTLSVIIVFLVLCHSLTNADKKCNEVFLSEITKFNITDNCAVKSLNVEFAWRFVNKTRCLDIALGGKIEGETGWMAWGLNPKGPQMIGTRALIGIKRGNNTLEKHKYNVSKETKLGCHIEPSEDNGLNVRSFSFFYMERIGYYVVQASIILSEEFNDSKMNVIWQMGREITETGPLKHPKSLHNFDATEVLNLSSSKILSYPASHLLELRSAHGVLNIAGWGVLLPIGAIIARYFRSFPIHSRRWFRFHVSCQLVGYFIGVMGWATGLWLGKVTRFYFFPVHGGIGTAIFAFATVQMMSLRLKPRFNDDYRRYWNMYHHLLGFSLLALISFNIFRGIKLFDSTRIWRRSYVGLLVALGSVVFVFEIYTWIKFCRPPPPSNLAGQSNSATNPPPSNPAGQSNSATNPPT